MKFQVHITDKDAESNSYNNDPLHPEIKLYFHSSTLFGNFTKKLNEVTETFAVNVINV